MSKKYSEKQLVEAVGLSYSIRQTLSKLSISPAGGNYVTIKKTIKNLEIDTSHFTGQSWNKNKTFPPKRQLNDYLENKFPIQSFKLKRRLLNENILQKKCSSCNLETWLEKEIPLELDHIDGNNKNNNLNNLRLLCPNCHAQTSTYRGKNKKK